MEAFLHIYGLINEIVLSEFHPSRKNYIMWTI
jgi:hypothetical protein